MPKPAGSALRGFGVFDRHEHVVPAELAMNLAITALLILTQAGCSLAVHAKPRFSAGKLACDSYAVPTLDLVPGLGLGGLAAFMQYVNTVTVGDRRCDDGAGASCPGSKKPYLLGAVAFAAIAASVHGYTTVAACRADLEASRKRYRSLGDR